MTKRNLLHFYIISLLNFGTVNGSNCDLPFDSGVEKPVDLEADDLYALRYKSIKPLVESGQVDLV